MTVVERAEAIGVLKTAEEPNKKFKEIAAIYNRHPK